MRVSIEHGEIREGIVRKTTYHTVSVLVEFTDEEKRIIEQRGLQRDVLLNRGVPANEDPSKYESSSLSDKLSSGNYLGLAVGIGKAMLTKEDIRVLRISTLIKGRDTFVLRQPSDAKNYEEELKDALVKMKGYILDNEGIEQKSTSFEL